MSRLSSQRTYPSLPVHLVSPIVRICKTLRYHLGEVRSFYFHSAADSPQRLRFSEMQKAFDSADTLGLCAKFPVRTTEDNPCLENCRARFLSGISVRLFLALASPVRSGQLAKSAYSVCEPAFSL